MNTVNTLTTVDKLLRSFITNLQLNELIISYAKKKISIIYLL